MTTTTMGPSTAQTMRWLLDEAEATRGAMPEERAIRLLIDDRQARFLFSEAEATEAHALLDAELDRRYGPGNDSTADTFSIVEVLRRQCTDAIESFLDRQRAQRCAEPGCQNVLPDGYIHTRCRLHLRKHAGAMPSGNPPHIYSVPANQPAVHELLSFRQVGRGTVLLTARCGEVDLMAGAVPAEVVTCSRCLQDRPVVLR